MLKTLSLGYIRAETEDCKKMFFHLQPKMGVIHQALQYVQRELELSKAPPVDLSARNRQKSKIYISDSPLLHSPLLDSQLLDSPLKGLRI